MSDGLTRVDFESAKTESSRDLPCGQNPYSASFFHSSAYKPLGYKEIAPRQARPDLKERRRCIFESGPHPMLLVLLRLIGVLVQLDKS
ncbi:MAG: hypothetical protein ACN6OC_13300 [Alcaligenes sp.]